MAKLRICFGALGLFLVDLHGRGGVVAVALAGNVAQVLHEFELETGGIDEIDSFPEWVFSAIDVDLKPLGFKSFDNAVYIVDNEAQMSEARRVTGKVSGLTFAVVIQCQVAIVVTHM